MLPFILILSITGSIYLFKPQIDRWEEGAWHDLSTQRAVSPDRQLAAAQVANPEAAVISYRLPECAGDTAMIEFGVPGGASGTSSSRHKGKTAEMQRFVCHAGRANLRNCNVGYQQQVDAVSSKVCAALPQQAVFGERPGLTPDIRQMIRRRRSRPR